jgi:hypothetical protein
MILWLLLACANQPNTGKRGTDPEPATALDTADGGTDSGHPDTPTDTPTDKGLEPLEAPRLLRRISLDITGQLPRTEDLDLVESDPAAITTLRAEYLASEAFTDRFVTLLNERWHTQVDSFSARQTDFGFLIQEEFAFERSVGDEPLRLMAHVASEDRPWSEIVTADYTIANRYLSEAFSLDTAISGEGWEVAHYTDGRPAAGVLSTNGLWWRYYTTTSNMNRARVAAIANLLLCKDYLARPVAFSGVEAVAESDISVAIRTAPECIACHSSIDPLAATLFGFWWKPLESQAELAVYHPEREPLGAALLEVEPAYFGVPVNSLADVGTLIAADPRFRRCTVETMASLYWRRPVVLTDFPTLNAINARFGDGTLKMHALIGEIMETESYQVGGLATHASEETADREVTVRMLSPDQLATAIAQVSGFEWTWRGFDQLANDEQGYRVLGGGVDGAEVFSHQSDASLSWALVVWRLAQMGAAHAVEHDMEDPESARLFKYADLDMTPEDAAFEEELRHLHWSLLARRADNRWLTDATELWRETEADSGSETAWTILLTTLFAHPEFVSR